MALAKFAPQIDPDLQKIVEDWEGLTLKAKNCCDLDQLCRARGVDSFHFIGVVAEAAYKFRDTASVIIAALSVPSIVQKSVQVALTTKGQKDRHDLMEHAGMFPMRPGAQFKILNVASANAEAGEEVPEGERSFEQDMKRIEESVD
jgi:hypothetical protein